LKVVFVVSCNGAYGILKKFAALEKTPNFPGLKSPGLKLPILKLPGLKLPGQEHHSTV